MTRELERGCAAAVDLQRSFWQEPRHASCICGLMLHSRIGQRGRRVVVAWCAAGLALAVLGCSGEPRDDIHWGSARLTWTVDRDAPPETCTTLGATRFVALLVTRGELVDRHEAPCTDFALDTRMLVAGDDYVVSASLQDERGTAKTAVVAASRFRLEPGQVALIDIDFGADAVINVSFGLAAADAPADFAAFARG
jgi:hypothetical protein